MNIDVEGQVPTENGQWRSGCMEESPFPELSFLKEPVSTIHWGIQEGTTPQVMLPVEEDQCFLPEVRSNDESVEPQTESKYITSESLGCEPNNQVLEDTQGEQIQMRTGVRSNYSYDYQVLETTREDNLLTSEGREDYLYFSSDDSDYEISENETEIKMNDIETVISRSADTVDIDCLTPENITIEQDKQEDINFLKRWKKEGKK